MLYASGRCGYESWGTVGVVVPGVVPDLKGEPRTGPRVCLTVCP